MKITVDRFTSDSESTISRVSVDGRFVCFGLEDEYRTFKIPGDTRIPSGFYQVRLRREGGTHQRYQKKFGTAHHGMLHLQQVPGFQYILIHIGNNETETDGCLLVGMQAVTIPGEMSVAQSTIAYQKLYDLVWQSAESGQLSIELQDNDRN